jgi:hypothetical protein
MTPFGLTTHLLAIFKVTKADLTATLALGSRPNSLDWGGPYIIKKLLERRCLKWAHMTHLDI